MFLESNSAYRNNIVIQSLTGGLIIVILIGEN